MKQTTQVGKSKGAGKSGQQCGRMTKIQNFVDSDYYTGMSPESKKTWKNWSVPERLAHILLMEKQKYCKVTF